MGGAERSGHSRHRAFRASRVTAQRQAAELQVTGDPGSSLRVRILMLGVRWFTICLCSKRPVEEAGGEGGVWG